MDFHKGLVTRHLKASVKLLNKRTYGSNRLMLLVTRSRFQDTTIPYDLFGSGVEAEWHDWRRPTVGSWSEGALSTSLRLWVNLLTISCLCQISSDMRDGKEFSLTPEVRLQTPWFVTALKFTTSTRSVSSSPFRDSSIRRVRNFLTSTLTSR